MGNTFNTSRISGLCVKGGSWLSTRLREADPAMFAISGLDADTQTLPQEMKLKIIQSLLIRSCILLAMSFGSPLQAQPGPGAKGKMMDGKMMDGKMMESQMTERRQKMMADVKAQDETLKDLVAKMNSAPDDKKLALMANVVTLLVEQRVAMNERRSSMMDEMFNHLMWHTRIGMENILHCPFYDEWKSSEDKVKPTTPSTTEEKK
jgi:hypothetical protein